ncbi:MAG TPA: hypothetical protein DDX19_08245 [Rhodopirellula baltica]|nr:hypothetical protein [Rhodopirellula baltica]
MLWNKARRHPIAFARATSTGQQPSPGTTWPTIAAPTRSRIHQNSVHAPVGHVPHGAHADALEQSEASSKRSRESNLHRQGTIARYNLAYNRRSDS